jgi:hypothetical protein
MHSFHLYPCRAGKVLPPRVSNADTHYARFSVAYSEKYSALSYFKSADIFIRLYTVYSTVYSTISEYNLLNMLVFIQTHTNTVGGNHT